MQANPEGEVRLKEAFKKLIERIGCRKLSQPKHINFRTTNKSVELEKYKKYSAGFRDKPRDHSKRLKPTANTTTTLHSMNCLFNHTHTSQTGSRLLYTGNSGRCHTESLSSGMVIQHKLKEYSELLIAKSYIFSNKTQPRKPLQLPRSAKASIITSSKTQKEGVRYFRNSRKESTKLKVNKKIQIMQSIKREPITPKMRPVFCDAWQTETHQDIF